jgi:PhnB protein
MAKRSLSEQLDQAVAAILIDPHAAALSVDSSIASLVRLVADLRELPSDAFRETLRQNLIRRASMAATTTAEGTRRVSPIREGFHTITPYLQVFRAAELIDFVKAAFGAEERFRSTGTGSAGGMHAEVRIGDSIVMIGGGGTWKGPEKPTAIHLYVEDADATYERAMRAGATSLQGPTDQPYGDREAGVKDLAGNFWYIATHQAAGRGAGSYRPEGFHTVTPFFHPHGAGRMIDFLKQAFKAQEVDCFKSPEGTVQHASLKIGDSMVELGEAHGQFQPMPTAIYMYVNDTDEVYRQAVQAGGTSTLPPTDQPYDDRNAWVDDPFGNSWYIATHVRDVTGS